MKQGFSEKKAPKTPHGCWCLHYEVMWRRYKYWYGAFVISMFFHGMISAPIILAAIIALVNGQ